MAATVFFKRCFAQTRGLILITLHFFMQQIKAEIIKLMKMKLFA